MTARILVVDDSQTSREILQNKLEEAGYEVVCALDGKEGLEKAKETKPDLIVTDMMMPNMDGSTMNEKLKADQEMKTIPLIMLSGKAQLDALFDANTGTPVDAYLLKPLQVTTLLEKVGELLKKKQSKNL